MPKISYATLQQMANHPHLRIGQQLVNNYPDYYGVNPTLFYMENDEFWKRYSEFIKIV